MNDDIWLPHCLAHLNGPYLTDANESVVIGELSGAERAGFRGEVLLHTALVPLDRLDEVLKHPGGIGLRVEAWGPGPIVDGDTSYTSDYWIAGPGGRDDKLEALVVSWDHHNKTVMMPDTGLLLCYGLCPRVLTGPDRMVWDNPAKPDYDVISVVPLSHYDVRHSHSGADVRIARRYLEDYASLKRCAVVAVYYEQRRCTGDDELEELLSGEGHVVRELPGRRLDLRINDHSSEKEFICQVWGCRLVLEPGGRPISEEDDPQLDWPGCTITMAHGRASFSDPMHSVYVSDEILEMFEGRPDYEIHPGLGAVSYGSWWSLSFARRDTRDYIAYEVRKLYEGCPPAIIEHVHLHLVDQEVAAAQRGERHIGQRAEALVEGFLSLGDELAAMADALQLPLGAKDFISLNRETVAYHGWWTRETLIELGHRAPRDMTEQRFLERCKDVYRATLEGLRPKALRNVLFAIGVPQDDPDCKKAEGVKLLAYLLQLCQLSLDSGLHILRDGEQLVARWDKERRVDAMQPLFSIVELRIVFSHRSLSGRAKRLEDALDDYGLNKSEQKTGWGIALDRVYDRFTEALGDVARAIRDCRAE